MAEHGRAHVVLVASTNAKGDWQIVTHGYLAAIGERVVRGRAFNAADTTDAMLVALINEEMARIYWPGRDPIGGRLKAAIRREIRAVNPNVPLADVRTMDEVVRAAMSTPRFTGILLAGFAALALTPAAIGVYGVLSYAVSRRTREIGICMAVGANRGAVMRMILTRGVTLALAGIAVGLIVAQWAVSLMRGLLYGVTTADPLTFAAVGAMLLAVAIVATAVPTWSATRVNPNVTLKTQ
jgi:predicted lysophospholipase L1 biosynthesis ABC-type transport system permease subunit